MTIGEFQQAIRSIYYERDRARGVLAAYAWLNEEAGELARAIRSGDAGALTTEMSDVLAWLTTLANLLDVDLEAAASRFAQGCPKCGNTPCSCPDGAQSTLAGCP